MVKCAEKSTKSVKKKEARPCKYRLTKKNYAQTKMALCFDLNVVPKDSQDIATTTKDACNIVVQGINIVVATNVDGHRNPHTTSTNDGQIDAEARYRPTKALDSSKQWGSSLKCRCLASFNIKTMYLLPHVTEICIFEVEHVNENRVQCRGLYDSGDCGEFCWHLSTEIKDFILTLF